MNKYIVRRWIVGIALVGITVFCLSQCNSCKHKDQSDLETMLKASQDSTRYYKNKLGQEVATRKVVEGSFANLQAIYTKDSIQHIADRFKAKQKEIKLYAKISALGHSNIPLKKQDSTTHTVITPHGDTCQVVTSMTGTFEDPYYTADVRLGATPHMHLESRDTLEIVVKDTTERHFLKKTTYGLINVIGKNPNMHYKILGVFKVAEKEARTKWAVTFGAGIGYNVPGIINSPGIETLKHPQLQVTLGISRVLIKIR